MQRVDRESSPLEVNQRLSRSLLWQLQRNYFERHGIEAWSSGSVPHHITSSPFIADAYARVVMGFLRDWSMDQHSETVLDDRQPVYIVELGSGSGRFAFSFLKKFLSLQRSSVLKDIPIKYVMTDFTKSNLDYLRMHPWLSPFIKEGLLDFARFDLESDNQFELLDSGETLANATLRNPLIVISNYVFDSTRQDAFLAANKNLFEIRVSLTATQNEIDTADPSILSKIDISAHKKPISGNYYEDAKWNRVLHDCKQRFTDTTFLFPTAALQCIRNLHQLSGGRMMLLSGDRGHSHDDLKVAGAIPTFALHGSFSMMVDFQIIGDYCQQLGGQVLHPARQTENLNISAFLFGDPAVDFIETRQAYAEAIEKFGPDDFFTLKEAVSRGYNSLTPDEMLTFLRLSCWDHKRFRECLPALKNHLSNLTSLQKQHLYEAILKVWDSYLPIGEENDLAFELGTLLLEIEFHEEALEFLQRSVDLYGMSPGAAYNIAVCYYGLNQMDHALDYLNQAMSLDQEFTEARDLYSEVQSALLNATRRLRRKRRA